MEPPSRFSSSGVKKGAWSQSEDTLLKQCIEKYGEGNWHRVPQRAGLNRCRKSCRLRWLNYLHPEIHRGAFSSDEIQLIEKMHKLLGNRWSLIAGRLPGRTANDIKNRWNTHIHNRKLVSSSPLNMNNQVIQNTETRITMTKPIKPRDHRLKKKYRWDENSIIHPDQATEQYVQVPNKATMLEFKQDQSMGCLESFLFQDYDANQVCYAATSGHGSNLNEESRSEWTDLCLNIDLWEQENTTMQIH